MYKKVKNLNITLSSLKKNKSDFGLIESISSRELSGWVYSKRYDINQIGFFIGKELVSLTQVNITRNDINSKFNINTPTGFRLLFNYKMGRKASNGSPKVCALDEDKKILFELKKIKNIDQVNFEKYIYHDYFGYEGRLDGVDSDGILVGWAGKRGYKGKINIWLQSDKNLDPQKIICNKLRKDLDEHELLDCGFEINPHYLTYQLREGNVWFTFDKEGKYNIDPQNKTIYLNLEKSKFKKVIYKESLKEGNKIKINKERLRLLKNFKQLLDKIERKK